MDNAEVAKKLMSSFQRFRRAMKGPPAFGGLKTSEMGLLFIISNKCEGETAGMKVSELSSKMHVTSPSITQLVTNLEERGLVERKMDPDDRRSVLVNLTEKGDDITKIAEQHFLDMLQGLVEYLGQEKSVQLASLFDDVLVYFSEMNK
jgi:DNA-binding MarR family transcriptional regulator